MQLVLFKSLKSIGWSDTANARPILKSRHNSWDFVSIVWGKRISKVVQYFPVYYMRDNCNVEIGLGLGKLFVGLKFPSNGKPIGYRSFRV